MSHRVHCCEAHSGTSVLRYIQLLVETHDGTSGMHARIAEILTIGSIPSVINRTQGGYAISWDVPDGKLCPGPVCCVLWHCESAL